MIDMLSIKLNISRSSHVSKKYFAELFYSMHGEPYKRLTEANVKEKFFAAYFLRKAHGPWNDLLIKYDYVQNKFVEDVNIVRDFYVAYVGMENATPEEIKKGVKQLLLGLYNKDILAKLTVVYADEVLAEWEGNPRKEPDSYVHKNDMAKLDKIEKVLSE